MLANLIQNQCTFIPPLTTYKIKLILFYLILLFIINTLHHPFRTLFFSKVPVYSTFLSHNNKDKTKARYTRNLIFNITKFIYINPEKRSYFILLLHLILIYLCCSKYGCCSASDIFSANLSISIIKLAAFFSFLEIYNSFNKSSKSVCK